MGKPNKMVQMNSTWAVKPVKVKYCVSLKTLVEITLTVNFWEIDYSQAVSPVSSIREMEEYLDDSSNDYLVYSLPVLEPQPKLSRLKGTICYVDRHYSRFYTDLSGSFEDYCKTFSSKSRSTVRRKIKKFTQKCSGQLDSRCYRTADELREFYSLARAISQQTYQEKLQGGGLPSTKKFQTKMYEMANDSLVWGFLLFDGNKAVAYLYFSIKNDVAMYEYLGYDPEYAKWSVGTILHWHASEYLFSDGKLKSIDYGLGGGDHKQFFGTGSRLVVDVFFLKFNLHNIFLVLTHASFNTVMRSIGGTLDHFKVKSRIKQLIRST